MFNSKIMIMTQQEKDEREDFRQRLMNHDDSEAEKQRKAEEEARKAFLESNHHKKAVFAAGEKQWAKLARREGWAYTGRKLDRETLQNIHPTW